MFDKLFGIATLPFDIAKDVVTLGGALTDEKSAVIDKLEDISGAKDRRYERELKKLEDAIELAERLKKLQKKD